MLTNREKKCSIFRSSLFQGRAARHPAFLAAGFAAIDTVYPHLIEVNVANPGGLATLSALFDRDCAAATAEALIDGLSAA